MTLAPLACFLALHLLAGPLGAESNPNPATPSVAPQKALAAALEKASQLVDKNPKLAVQFALEAQALARDLGARTEEAEATYILADAARAQGEHREAVEAFLQAKALFTELGNEFEVGRCLRRLGDLYYFLTDFDTAVAYYLSARETFSRLARSGKTPKASLHLAHLHAAIGNVLNAMGDVAEARTAYESAVKAYTALNYPLGVAGATYNLGLVVQASGNLDEAMALYRQAEKVARELDDPYLESLALSSEASVHLARRELEHARELVHRSLQLCQHSQRPRGILDNLLKLARIELAASNPREASDLLEQAEALALKLGDKLLQAEALQLRAQAAENTGAPAQALQLFRQATAIREQVRSNESSARINKLRIAYEIKEKEQRIALLEANQRWERAFRWGLLAMLALAASLLAVLGSRYRLRVKTERLIASKNRELEAAYRRVDELSRTDELTQLPNRRAIVELLAQEEKRAQRGDHVFSLVLCDLDDFKKFNDTFGHECGDFVLAEMAARLRSHLRASDTVARWGGEEFLLLLPDTDLSGACVLADKLRQAVASVPFRWQGHELALTATFGVYECRQGSASEAIRRADQAMYQGKRAGKNCVIAEAAS